jgi:hypothetical protein
MRKRVWHVVIGALLILGLAPWQAFAALSPRVTWEYTDQGTKTYIGFLTLTPEGRILATRNGFQDPAVIEINEEGETVWEYGPIQANSAIPLANGNILIADSGAPGYPNEPRIMEINHEGQLLWSHAFTGRGNSPRLALPLPGNRYLVVLPDRVVELDRSGTVHWQHSGLYYPVWAERLANGNTLIVDRGFYGGQVLEVDRRGQIVWTYGDYGSPEGSGDLYRPVWATRLADGSTVISDRGKAQLLKVHNGETEVLEEWKEVLAALPVADRWVALPDLSTKQVYLSLTLTSGRSVIWQAEPSIKTFLGEEPYKFGTPVILMEGVLYGGARELLNLVGAEVAWQGETKELEIFYEGEKSVVTVDSTRGIVGGRPVNLAPPKIHGGTTLLPLEFVRDYFGLDYSWDEEGRILRLEP